VPGAASRDHRGGRRRLLFLASHYAGAMTGDTIYIDGDYHILG
jgi:enoyl-[acyl-carrier-protein] reductase (NADH)